MTLTLSDIASAVHGGQVTAISLDTSIFDQKQRGLEWGLLKAMRQFNGGSVTFVMSDIVARELEAHLLNDAEESLAALRKAVKGVGTPWLVATEQRKKFIEDVCGTESPQSIAKKRLDRFIATTGANVIKAADHVSAEGVLPANLHEIDARLC